MKLAVIIGTTYDGTPYCLPECKNDATTLAAYLKLCNNRWDIALLAGPSVGLDDILETKQSACKARDVLFFFSGHGYYARDGKEVESGIYTGHAIPHKRLMDEYFMPIFKSADHVLRIYDCCYAGTARRPKHAQDVLAPVKCLKLGDTTEPSEIEAYYPRNVKNDAVIAACRAKQYAYGAFKGQPGTWCTFDTQGHSLMSYYLCSAFLWRTNLRLDMAAKDLAYRCRNGLIAFTPYREYRNREFQIADVVSTVTQKFPYDFLVRR